MRRFGPKAAWVALISLSAGAVLADSVAKPGPPVLTTKPAPANPSFLGSWNWASAMAYRQPGDDAPRLAGGTLVIRRHDKAGFASTQTTTGIFGQTYSFQAPMDGSLHPFTGGRTTEQCGRRALDAHTDRIDCRLDRGFHSTETCKLVSGGVTQVCHGTDTDKAGQVFVFGEMWNRKP